jgi:hypothetical protein
VVALIRPTIDRTLHRHNPSKTVLHWPLDPQPKLQLGYKTKTKTCWSFRVMMDPVQVCTPLLLVSWNTGLITRNCDKEHSACTRH